jgi:hypothetical protein
MVLYWDDSNPIPAYYLHSMYSWLYDDYAEGSRWSGEELARWIDVSLTRRTFDPQLLEEQLTGLFSVSRDSYSWEIVADLDYHHLIHFTLHTPESVQFFPIIWSRDKTIQIIDSWDNYIRIVEENGMSIVNHIDNILTIFTSFQQKHILYRVTRPDDVIPKFRFDLLEKLAFHETPTYDLLSPEAKHPILFKYAEIVTRPGIWGGKTEQQAKFWTIEKRTGNLEEWLFIQKDGRLSVQSWLREEGFVSDIEDCLLYSKIPHTVSTKIDKSATPFIPPLNK